MCCLQDTKEEEKIFYITTDGYFQNKSGINGVDIFGHVFSVLVCLIVEHVSTGGGTRGLGQRELANRKEKRTIRRERNPRSVKTFRTQPREEERREGDRGEERYVENGNAFRIEDLNRCDLFPTRTANACTCHNPASAHWEER